MSETITIPIHLPNNRSATIICPRDITSEDCGIISLHLDKLRAQIAYKADPSKSNLDVLHRLNMEILKTNDISKELEF